MTINKIKVLKPSEKLQKKKVPARAVRKKTAPRLESARVLFATSSSMSCTSFRQVEIQTKKDLERFGNEYYQGFRMTPSQRRLFPFPEPKILVPWTTETNVWTRLSPVICVEKGLLF